MRATHRPRRFASPAVLKLGAPVLAFDPGREAYLLRLIGGRYGPVLRPNRRRDAAGDVRRGRRRTGPAVAGENWLEGPSETRQLAVIGGVTMLAVLVGLAITLLPHGSISRAASEARSLASQRTSHPAVPAAIVPATVSTAASAPATPSHRAATARRAHRTARHRATVTHRTRRHHAVRRHHHVTFARPVTHRAAPAPTPTATAPAATTTPTPTTASPAPAPVHTTPAPVHVAPAPVHTTPAPVHTAPAPVTPAPAPAPVHTTPSGTGSPGSGGGTSSSGSSGGSGTVSGGG